MTWKLFKFGYPTCHVSCARHYCTVLYDLGNLHEIQFKLSLS